MSSFAAPQTLRWRTHGVVVRSASAATRPHGHRNPRDSHPAASAGAHAARRSESHLRDGPRAGFRCSRVQLSSRLIAIGRALAGSARKRSSTRASTGSAGEEINALNWWPKTRAIVCSVSRSASNSPPEITAHPCLVFADLFGQVRLGHARRLDPGADPVTSHLIERRLRRRHRIEDRWFHVGVVKRLYHNRMFG